MNTIFTSTRHFSIPDHLVDNPSASDDGGYIDINEIRRCVCPWIPIEERERAACRCTFNVQGLFIRSDGDVRGILMGETDENIATWNLWNGTHYYAFRRIYFNGTTAHGLRWIGKGENE